MTGGRYWQAARSQREAKLLASGGAPPNPRRITMALDARGLDGPEVDVACGGVEPMVDEWEAGTRTPTEHQLQLLADLTGMTIEWFYGPGPQLTTMFICQRSGPGKGCTVIDRRPWASVTALTPAADVSRETSAPEAHPDTLF